MTRPVAEDKVEGAADGAEADAGEATVLEPAMSGVFVMACDQAAKLGIGATSSMISYYENNVIVQLNVAPLVLSFIGSHQVNAGAVLAMAPELYAGLEPLCRVVMDFEE